MKVTFSYPTRTLSGKEDDTVFGAYRHNNLCLARKFVYPEIVAQHHKIGNIAKNLAIVYRNAAAPYKADFKAYAKTYGKRTDYVAKIPPNGYALFLKMMQAWFDSDPTHVDLSNVTIADIVALDADVRNISRAVDAGFLPTVKGYTAFVAGIQ
jgi:hypothetical protein